MMMKRFAVVACFLLGACAGVLGCASEQHSQVTKSDDDGLAAAIGTGPGKSPNGKLSICKLGPDVVPLGNLQVRPVLLPKRVTLAIPESPDWKLQCDMDEFFWAQSISRRIQFSLMPGHVEGPSDVVEEAALRELLETNGKRLLRMGITQSGLQVATVKRSGGSPIPVASMHVESRTKTPESTNEIYVAGIRLPGLGSLLLQATAYPRDAAEKAKLREEVLLLVSTFNVPPQTQDAPPAAQPVETPVPSMPGVSTQDLSPETTVAIRKALECGSPKDAHVPYCKALDRFDGARPFPVTSQGAWVAATLFGIKQESGMRTVEGVHHFVVRNGAASFNTIKPSSAEESQSLKAIHAGILQGTPPARSTQLMKYVAGMSPMFMGRLESRAGSTVFEPTPSMGNTPGPLTFVRETDQEILLVEVWGEGRAVKVGIIPKN